MTTNPTHSTGGEALPTPGITTLDCWQPCYPDDPETLIPVCLHPGSTFSNIPASTPPALAQACAAFDAGCLHEAERLVPNPETLRHAPVERYVAADLCARLLLCHGEWDRAAELTASEWSRISMAVDVGGFIPHSLSLMPALCMTLVGHHKFALLIARSLAGWAPNYSIAHLQAACELSRLGRPEEAAEAISAAFACSGDVPPLCNLVCDADLRPMLSHFAANPPNEKARAHLFGPFADNDELFHLHPGSFIDIVSFREVPRKFVGLFIYDPLRISYVLTPMPTPDHADLTAEFSRWYAGWWLEGVRLVANASRPAGAPPISHEEFGRTPVLYRPPGA